MKGVIVYVHTHGKSVRMLRAVMATVLCAATGVTTAELYDSLDGVGATVGLGDCTCLNGASDADLISALGWVCDPGSTGGRVNCSAINAGGAHFYPNDAVHHADYAFTEYYHEKGGPDTCFFAGNAAVTPSPLGHWLFVKDGDSITLDYPYQQARQGMGQWDTIPGGKTKSYLSADFSGKYHPGASSTFSLWFAATTIPASVAVDISYYLPCISTNGSVAARHRHEQCELPAFARFISSPLPRLVEHQPHFKMFSWYTRLVVSSSHFLYGR